MRIPIRYGNPWRWILPLFLLPARLAYIRIDGDLVRVRMSWAFRLKFPKPTVQSVTISEPNMTSPNRSLSVRICQTRSGGAAISSSAVASIPVMPPIVAPQPGRGLDRE